MRYSHFSSNAPSQSTRAAYHTLQALAMTDATPLAPLRCDTFLADLFKTVGALIDGDVRPPSFPERYMAGREEGVAAVFFLLYAAFRKRVSDCSFVFEEEGEDIRLTVVGSLRKNASEAPLLQGNGEQPMTLLHRVARESGFSFFVSQEERLSLSFCFRRFRAEVQIAHSVDVARASRMAELLQKLLPLVARPEKAFL